MTMNFAEALQAPIDDIQRPKNPPIGPYIFQITKLPKIGEIKSTNGDFDTIDFSCQAVVATDEVDAAEVEAYGLKNVICNYRFMFDRADATKRERSEFNLKTFLTEHVGAEGSSLKELMNNSLNQRFLGATRLRPNPDNAEIQYFEISKTAPAT